MIAIRLLFLALMVCALFALLTKKLRNQLLRHWANGSGNLKTFFHAEGNKP